MAHAPQDSGEALNEVNVIPLADVTLVLLIILMVISPLVSQALIQVQSAQATAAQTQEEAAEVPETPIIVSFAPGELKLNGTVMGSDVEFTTRLNQILLHRKNREVILTASPKMQHGKVVWIMDLIKRNGAQALTMVRWKDEPEEVAS
jgi:biopolymer transport protein ExbD